MVPAYATPVYGMSASSPKAIFLSFALHASVAALILWLGYLMNRAEPEPVVFELVAGEGDNFAATEAPALGTPGLQVELPTPVIKPAPVAPPVIKAEPPKPQPVQPQPAPVVTKAPPPPKVVEKPAPKREVVQPTPAPKQKEETKRLTKADFDRLHKAKSAPPRKAAPPKIAKIDAMGISKGVIGGSTKNTAGGAGGRALTATRGDELERYFALFKQRLKQYFEPPPGLSDNLVAVVNLRSNANGSLTNARIVKSSGSAEFDQAVLSAIRRTPMPPRPDRKSETITFPFTLRERDDP